MNLLVQIIAARKLENFLPDGKVMTRISKKMQVGGENPHPVTAPGPLVHIEDTLNFFVLPSASYEINIRDEIF